MRRMMLWAAPAALMVVTAVAPASARMAAPGASTFVMKAGASDLFERREAQVMDSSTNPKVRAFAERMMRDHTKSTDMVVAAAKADGMHPGAPMLDPQQKNDLSALEAAHGAARDRLYISQQKMAHDKALALMQSYASDGNAPHLKQTAGQIVPVIQQHIDMLHHMG